MAKMYSDNARTIVGFLRENPNVNLTGKELAEAVGLQPRVANGTITSLVSKGLAIRTLAIVNGKEVKFVQLTDEGKTVDLDADKPE